MQPLTCLLYAYRIVNIYRYRYLQCSALKWQSIVCLGRIEKILLVLCQVEEFRIGTLAILDADNRLTLVCLGACIDRKVQRCLFEVGSGILRLTHPSSILDNNLERLAVLKRDGKQTALCADCSLLRAEDNPSILFVDYTITIYIEIIFEWRYCKVLYTKLRIALSEVLAHFIRINQLAAFGNLRSKVRSCKFSRVGNISCNLAYQLRQLSNTTTCLQRSRYRQENSISIFASRNIHLVETYALLCRNVEDFEYLSLGYAASLAQSATLLQEFTDTVRFERGQQIDIRLTRLGQIRYGTQCQG